MLAVPVSLPQPREGALPLRGVLGQLQAARSSVPFLLPLHAVPHSCGPMQRIISSSGPSWTMLKSLWEAVPSTCACTSLPAAAILTGSAAPREGPCIICLDIQAAPPCADSGCADLLPFRIPRTARVTGLPPKVGRLPPVQALGVFQTTASCGIGRPLQLPCKGDQRSQAGRACSSNSRPVSLPRAPWHPSD